MNTDPWTCPDATSRSPSGLQSSHSPTPGPTGAPQRAQGWVGSAVGTEAVGVTPRWCHETGCCPDPRARTRAAGVTSGTTDSTSASMSSVDRAVTIAPSAPASRQRSHSSRGACTQGESTTVLASLPSALALEPDDDRLVLARPTRLLERLEVDRQVRLEVVVERRPAIADPRRQRGRRTASRHPR